MTVYTKRLLSGSTDGKQILISATTSGGANTIHTAVSGTTEFDESWIYATNNDTSNVNLTILWGGTSSPADYIQLSVPYKQGLYLIIPGLILQNGMVVKAFAGTTNVISLSGWVNRIT